MANWAHKRHKLEGMNASVKFPNTGVFDKTFTCGLHMTVWDEICRFFREEGRTFMRPNQFVVVIVDSNGTMKTEMRKDKESILYLDDLTGGHVEIRSR